MATVTRPATSLPDPGDDLEAEPIRDYINNVLTFLEGNNIDDANVDFTSTDGIMALRKNQTVTGIKTHTGNIVLSGTAAIDLNGIANALILDADADTHISAPTDDQIDIAIGGTDLIVLATAGSTFSHPVTVGVDDTGYDVKFFGATTGKYMLWDESADTLAVVGTAITLNGTAVGNASVGTANTWTADQTFNDNVNITLGTGGDADLYYDATNVVLNPKVVGSGVFNVLGNMGVGIAHTDGTLHVHTASAGTVTAATDADDLVIENSGNGGISILTPDANLSVFKFGHPSEASMGIMRTDYTNNVMEIGTNRASSALKFMTSTFSEAMRIDSSGMVGIGDTANANMTVGLTINQSTADNEILAFKSSDVAHGYIGLMETDTYGAQLKIAADTGGLKTYAVAESTVGKAYQVQAYCGAPGVTPSTSQEGIFTYYAAVHNGSNSVVACAENSVMYSFRARNAANSDVTLMTIDEDGDIAVDGSSTVGTFDTEMDYQLVRGARQVLQPELLTGAKDLATKYSDLLHENRIVIRGEDGRPYLNLKRGLLLSWDMGYQIGQKVYEEMDPRIAKLEQKLALLEERN